MQDAEGVYFPLGKELSPARTLHVIGKGDTIVSMGEQAFFIFRTDTPLM